MWDDLRYTVIDHVEKLYYVSIKLSFPHANNNWWLTMIYGLTSRRNKNDFGSNLMR